MFSYTLSEKDIITYMLYYVSSKRKIKSKGNKALWIFSGYFVVLAIVSYAMENIITSIVMLCLALLLVLYILFLRDNLLAKSIKKIAIRDLKDMIGSQVQLEINEDHLHIRDQAGDYKYLFSGVVLISELKLHYFIKLNNAHCIIIPKVNDEMERSVNFMISNYKLPHNLELNFEA